MENNVNDMDLELSLGITNHTTASVDLCSNRDAGAGANANANSNLPTRRLSELVWSTQNGLTIKCTNNPFTDNNKKEMPPSCIFKETQMEDHLISPRSITPAPFLGSSLSHTDENVGEVHLTEIVNSNKGKEKECMSIPDANVAGTSDRFSLDFGLCSKMHDLTQSACQQHPTKEEDCITAGCAPKIEETAENDVILKNVESHGESGNKRWRFGEHLFIQSKRIKKQSQECPPPLVKQQDSSFMNWISNMVKSVKPNGIDDHKTWSKGLGFQTVFQSLYSQDGKRAGVESSKSKEIILFNKTVSNLLTLDNKSSDNVSASLGLDTPCKIEDTRSTCLHINENRNVLLKKNKLWLKIPKQIFETIKRLRLSRTDILKWMNSGLPVENLEGYFLRLRLAKWEEGVGGSGYYVACITDEKGSKKSICVNIGGVEWLVESRYISNCDFLEDEVVAWWRTSGGQGLMEEKLSSKLEERNKLGF